MTSDGLAPGDGGGSADLATATKESDGESPVGNTTRSRDATVGHTQNDHLSSPRLSTRRAQPDVIPTRNDDTSLRSGDQQSVPVIPTEESRKAAETEALAVRSTTTSLAAPRPDPLVLGQSYAPIVMERLQRAGVALRPPSQRWPAKAIQSKTPGRSSPEINVFCRHWDVILDSETQQIRFFSNSEFSADRSSELVALINSPNSNKTEFDTPGIAETVARRIVADRDFLRVFGVGEEELALREPLVLFHAAPEQRGWHFDFVRTSNGYPFWDEGINLVLDDGTGELVYFRSRTSEAVPPEPDVNLTIPDVRRAVLQTFTGKSEYAETFRAEGLTYVDDTLVVGPPQYVHANFALGDGSIPTHSFDYPLKLAYICRFNADNPTEGAHREYLVWVDASDGTIAGGDYSHTNVVRD